MLFGLVSCWNFGDISRHGGLRGKEKAKIHQLVKRLAVARCPLFSSARHPWSFFRCGKQQQQRFETNLDKHDLRSYNKLQ